MSLKTDLKGWHSVTTVLPWGVQSMLLQTLDAVKEGQINLVHGADYRDGRPCLINAVGNMINEVAVSPSEFAPAVVGYFDAINRQFQEEANGKINDDTGFVSPLAAEVLIRNFGRLQIPEDSLVTASELLNEVDKIPYSEPSDAMLAEAWLNSMRIPSPSEVMSSDDLYAKQYVTSRIFNDEDEYH